MKYGQIGIQEMINNDVACKYCQSKSIVKYGTYKGVQRYFCKDCQRKFKGDNALFHMKVSPEYISSALSMYYSGMSISDIRNHLKQEHGYYPSKHIVFEWVEKYTDKAINHFRDIKPKVGDTWIADETMIDLDNRKVWFWDIIDADTRFLLASRVSLVRTSVDAQKLMEQAMKRAGKSPKVVITDKLRAYLDGVEMTFGSDTEHRQSKPFTVAEDSTNKIERFHGTLKDRIKVMRSFRDMDTAIQFTDGFLVYYNFLRPHEALGGKTPAEVAGVEYQTKNWKDISRIPVSKQEEIQSHITPKIRIVITKPRLQKKPRRGRVVRSPTMPTITSIRMGKLA